MLLVTRYFIKEIESMKLLLPEPLAPYNTADFNMRNPSKIYISSSYVVSVPAKVEKKTFSLIDL